MEKNKKDIIVFKQANWQNILCKWNLPAGLKKYWGLFYGNYYSDRG